MKEFDAVDLVGKQAQHRSLVTATGSDLQNATEPARAAIAQQFDHPRDHTRLGDGLAQADRQARVFVRLTPQCAVHEPVTLHRRHGRHDERIGQPLPGQLPHHIAAQGARIGPKRGTAARRGGSLRHGRDPVPCGNGGRTAVLGTARAIPLCLRRAGRAMTRATELGRKRGPRPHVDGFDALRPMLAAVCDQ